MDFGTNLKQLRKEKNLTQEEMAECLNVSPQTVSKWENNLSTPDIALLPILADYFGITVDALLSLDASAREAEKKAFAKEIHSLVDAGKAEEAYAVLKSSIGKWALSASMNHLMCWTAYRVSEEKEGKDRQRFLEEAVMYADRAIRLDGGETSKAAQATMTKCYCMVDLGRRPEAIKIATRLPSLYSSRERVLAKITEGDEQKAYAETAVQYLTELREEMQDLMSAER